MNVRRSFAWVSLFVLVVVLLGLVQAAPASARGVDCSHWPAVLSPFPAPDAVGVPNLNESRGAIEVVTPAGRRVVTRESLGLGTAMPGDRFGAALALVSYSNSPDADVCMVLAVGAPGVAGRRGAVYIVYGLSASRGFTAGQAVRLPEAAVGDEFGRSLSTSQGGGIAAGAPGRDVGGVKDAGAIAFFKVSDDHSNRPEVLQVITQASPGVSGSPESGDRFGEVLSSSYSSASGPGYSALVGVPHEDVGGAPDAGMAEEVFFEPTSSGSLGRGLGWSQNSSGIPGVAEAGDRFGAAIAFEPGRLAALGAPGEDVGSVRDAGSVTFMYASYTNEDFVITFSPRSAVTQNSPRVPGSVEAGDQFGAAVVSRLPDCLHEETFAIGAPGEDIGSRRDAGGVVLFDTGAAFPEERPCPSVWIHQGGGAPGRAESGDHFGAQVALGPRGLYISAPGEDLSGNKIVNAGVVDIVTPENIDLGSVSEQTLIGGPVPDLRYAVLPSRCACHYG